MTYAGQRNFPVATGADNLFAVRFHRQGTLVDASTLVAGDFVVYDRRIWPVFAVAPAGTGKTTIRLGHGAFYEPELTLNDDDQVPLAPAAIWEEIDMQVSLPTRPLTMVVPATIENEGTVCLINIDAAWLEPFQQSIDYGEQAASGMPLPYDLVGMFDGQRIRVLTGTISIIRSAASPAVAPPEVPE